MSDGAMAVPQTREIGARWGGREVLLLTTGAVAVTATSLTQVLAVPLVPLLAAQSSVSYATASWVATATLISSAISSPVVGRLGDTYTYRSLAIGCVLVMLSGSLIGLGSQSFTALMIGRFVQGFGAGLIPVVFAMMRQRLSPSKAVAGTSIAMVGGVGVGAGLGPAFAGWVLSESSIRMLFAINAAVLVLALGLFLLVRHERGSQGEGKFDAVGSAALAVLLCSSMLYLTKGPDWGWSRLSTIAMAVVACIALPFWIGWEKHSDAPVVDLRLNTQAQPLLAHAGGVAMGFATFAQFTVVFTLVTLPADSEFGFGRTVATAGVVQFPGAVCMMAAVLVTARSIARWTPRVTMLVGASTLAVGLLVGATWHESLTLLAASVVTVDVGLGVMVCSMPILILESVPQSASGAVNSVNSLARQVGSVGGSAVGATLLTASTVTIGNNDYPSERAFVALYVLAASLAVVVVLIALRQSSGRARRGSPPTSQQHHAVTEHGLKRRWSALGCGRVSGFGHRSFPGLCVCTVDSGSVPSTPHARTPDTTKMQRVNDGNR